MSGRAAGAALALLILAFSALLPPALDAQDDNRAGLVVRSADGDIDAMCVAFDDEAITGAELLRRSGVDYVAESSSIGTALCSIDGSGCDEGDCFCEYPSFWGYWVRDSDDDGWRFSDVGAADREVRDGSMDAWSFGKDGKPAPEATGFADVCDGAATVRATSSGDNELSGSSRPNYAVFAAFVVLLAAAAFAVKLRRSRR